jgi:hypothetical protein
MEGVELPDAVLDAFSEEGLKEPESTDTQVR